MWQVVMDNRDSQYLERSILTLSSFFQFHTTQLTHTHTHSHSAQCHLWTPQQMKHILHACSTIHLTCSLNRFSTWIEVKVLYWSNAAYSEIWSLQSTHVWVKKKMSEWGQTPDSEPVARSRVLTGDTALSQPGIKPKTFLQWGNSANH